jgi:hypothetical protein
MLPVFRAFDGKRLTKPVAAKFFEALPKEGAPWHLNSIAGHTNLESDDYFTKRGEGPYISMLVAHTTGIVTVTVEDLLRYNPGYFSAREERNRWRQAAMQDDERCQIMADTLNASVAAHKILQEAGIKMKELCAYGTPFYPDSTMWDKLGGK